MSIFNKIPVPKVKRTSHQLNNSVKFTTQFGFESPTVCRKVVPGDVLSYQHAHRIDFAPLSTKLLQEFRVKQEAFYVPTRILWPDFEKFFPADENEIIHPYWNPATFAHELHSMWNELDDDARLRTDDKISQNLLLSALGPKSLLRTLYRNTINFFYSPKDDDDDPPAPTKVLFEDLVPINRNLDFLRYYAYLRIMAEYYLDENLQSSLIELFTDSERFKSEYSSFAGDMSHFMAVLHMSVFLFNCFGVTYDESVDSSTFSYDFSDYISQSENYDSINFYYRGFVFRNYPKDYFTSALPWKQKGASVMIPQLSGQDVSMYIDSDYDIGSGQLHANGTNFVVGEKVGSAVNNQQQVNLGLRHYEDDVADNTYLRLRTVVGKGVTSIEDFRTAYQLQQWLERNARGGTRYKEQILSHFGIKTKDSRLDRPEFLLGTTDVISHGDVFTTYQDEAGNGVPAESVTRLSGAGRSMRIAYRVTEHGYFINLFCLFPKASYSFGVDRESMELDKFDYFWPEFEHLGEQEIVQDELIAGMGGEVFGYTPRYAQYKCAFNDVYGEFARDLLTFTDFRHFTPNSAYLNSKFIQIDPIVNNLNRIFNVVNAKYDKIYVDLYNNLFMLRPMSYYGTPRLVL